MARKKITKDEALRTALTTVRYDASTGELFNIATNKKRYIRINHDGYGIVKVRGVQFFCAQNCMGAN